jgi:DNA-binding NtrC family response regulator
VGALTRTNTEVDTLDIHGWRQQNAPQIIGESEELLDALEMAARVAEFDCSVLITGESGTGKELLAQAIHQASGRQQNAFIPVNCPAIPKELVESELFGHSKGAFTGATAARVGRFAAADKGTLFLDEIGDMALDIQAKLLRALQENQITPVGESRPRDVDVRIVAATNRDLEELAESGGFRADLFYRLNVVQIHLPALRERRSDIPVLIEALVERISARLKVDAPEIGPEVLAVLTAYDWPGNIRQLRNIIERLVILRRGQQVRMKDLPPRITKAAANENAAADQPGASMTLPPEGLDLRQTLQELEAAMIRQALMTTDGNKNKAAKLLGLNRTTLVEKLRKQPALAVA